MMFGVPCWISSIISPTSNQPSPAWVPSEITVFAFSASSGLAYLLEELRRRGVTVSRLRTWARDGSW